MNSGARRTASKQALLDKLAEIGRTSKRALRFLPRS
jgi:hypothetical protein